MKKKQTGMREKILAVIAFFGLVAMIWGVFTYLERFALCETTNKQFEMMKQTQQKQMEYFDQKTEKMQQLFDYKLKDMELKSVEEQIYRIEKEFGTSPKDPTKKADLERLRREREKIMQEMKVLQKK